MDVKEIRKHRGGALYWTRKKEGTQPIAYVAASMESVISAYRKMWNQEPYAIEKGSEAEAIVIES